MNNIQIWERIDKPHIYLVVNSINGKKYVGQHSGKQRNYFASGTAVQHAIKKYGKHNFNRFILQYWDEAPLDMDKAEEFWIIKENSLVPNGYNISTVGTGRLQHNHTPWNKGGGEYSEESRLKMRNSKLGTTLKESHKSNISQTLLGKPKSETHRLNIRKGQSKPVIQMDLEGNFIKEYLGASFAVEENPILDAETIKDCCRGRSKTHRGFKWAYK